MFADVKRPSSSEMLRRGGLGCAHKFHNELNGLTYSKSGLEMHAQVKYLYRRTFCPAY